MPNPFRSVLRVLFGIGALAPVATEESRPPRWLTFEPGDRSEEQSRQRTLAAIDSWWSAFAAKRGALELLFANKQQWDLPGWMAQELGAVSPKLMWEFGPGLPT